jgi:hypothetical protein
VKSPATIIPNGCVLRRPGHAPRSWSSASTLTAHNADGTTGVPMPAVPILDAGQVLRWIDVHPDYATRTEPGEVLAALDRL